MKGERRGMKASKNDKMRKGWLGGRKEGRKKIMKENNGRKNFRGSFGFYR